MAVVSQFIYLCLSIYAVAKADAYKPVVIFHGVLSGSESMVSLQRFIESVWVKYFIHITYRQPARIPSKPNFPVKPLMGRLGMPP